MTNVHQLPEGRTLTQEEVTGLALKGGGGSGTSGGMSEIVDAKIAAAEARTDTKFAQVLSELRTIKDSTRGTKTTIIVTAIAAVGVAVGVMAFGASQFGNGVMVTTASVQDAADAKRLAQENAAEVRAMRNDLSAFIQAVRRDEDSPQFAPMDPQGFRHLPAPSE